MRVADVVPKPLARALLAVLLPVLAAVAFPSGAMTFQSAGAPDLCGSSCILAAGLIDKDSARQFDAFVAEHHVARGTVVALSSDGGVLLYGLALGDHIRRAGMNTTVLGPLANAGGYRLGRCASACTFSFLGGVQRTVAKDARIGVHQIYSNAQARDSISVSDVQSLTSLTVLHVERMGGRMGILALALSTPPEIMRWLSASELSGLGVVSEDLVALASAR